MSMFFPKYLEEGATETKAVKLLQAMLLFSGYRNEIDIDGQFGRETGLGVMRLQTSLGLTMDDLDGKFGPHTRSMLALKRMCYIDSIPADFFERRVAETGRQSFFPESLAQGSGDVAAAKLLQLMLLFAGYNNNIIPDGDYGMQTATGVQKLQESLGFATANCNGRFGLKTRLALHGHRGIEIDAIPADIFETKTAEVQSA